MNKEQEIEEMAKIIETHYNERNPRPANPKARVLLLDEWKNGELKWLVEAGYGNVKQAVKEFAEKLKECSTFAGDDSEDCRDWEVVSVDDIDYLFEELYGND